MKTGKEYLFCKLFIGTGMLLLVIGVILAVVECHMKDSSGIVVGTIEEIEHNKNGNDKAIVSYEVVGIKYEKQLPYFINGMKEGNTELIYYEINNPNNIINWVAMKIIVLTLGILGIVFFCVGGIPGFILLRKEKRREELCARGIRIYAQIDKIEMITTIRVNSQYPYRIYCSYHDTYNEHIYSFKTGLLWDNPKKCIEINGIKEIPFYVEHDDYSKYACDMNYLKQLNY